PSPQDRAGGRACPGGPPALGARRPGRQETRRVPATPGGGGAWQGEPDGGDPRRGSRLCVRRRDLRDPEEGLLRLPGRQGAPVSRSAQRVRLLIGKVGLDGHDRGAKIVARALRDAGFEVIYTGLHQTPEMVVATAVQEDVDGIGLSLLSGAHNTIFPKVMKLLAARKSEDIVVFGGGIIPEEDMPGLQSAGIRKVFTPGTTTQEFIDWVKANVPPRRR